MEGNSFKTVNYAPFTQCTIIPDEYGTKLYTTHSAFSVPTYL